jgi:CubicO group peptidase (beta-lactamase class C family)
VTVSLRRAVGVFLASCAIGGFASAHALREDPRVASSLELARTWLEAERAYERIPGISAAIVHDQDEVLWEGGFGQADGTGGRPASADTIYGICSISKLFTSIAVMRQRDAGKLLLEDPVGKHLSWFRLKKTRGEGDVTIEGLLTHASGLPRESDYPYWSAPDFRFPTREQIIEKIASQGGAVFARDLLPVFEPGTHKHTFQRIREDETLGETVVFEMGPDGRAARFTQHSNLHQRIH